MEVDPTMQGFRWPVGVTGSIAAPAADVWATISTPGNLERCHPFCEKNPVKTWPGAGSRDEVHYLNGMVYERRLSRWIEGIGYDLDIGRARGKSSIVSWRIAPIDDHTSVLRIVVFPHVLQDVPVAIRRLPHLLWVRPRLTAYLSSVVQGFAWYVERGEPVRRNQFGSHPWFSDAARSGRRRPARNIEELIDLRKPPLTATTSDSSDLLPEGATPLRKGRKRE